MTDTATKVLSRMLFGEVTPTQIRAKINQVSGGSFASIYITFHVAASMFSPERTSEQLQDDIRRAVDAKYGVKGVPFLSIETDHQKEGGTDRLFEDVISFGNCTLCNEPLKSWENERDKLFGGRCYECFKSCAN